MKNYIEHLKAQVKYWQMISAAEREKNIKLEKIIKAIDFYILSTGLDMPYQIDLVCMNGDEIELVENISY